MKRSVLVVDDEATIQETLRWRLEQEGCRVVTVGSGEDALARLETESFDVVIADILLPGIGGLDVLERAVALEGRPSVILITAYATVDTAIEALRRGVADYVRKPFKLDELAFRVRRLLDARHQPSSARGGPAADGEEWPRHIIGESPAISAVRQQIARSGPTVSSVLVTGETGTGKELVARALHAASPRRLERFVAINCAAIPGGLFETQLFGHARGAFTGAVGASPGVFALAHRGTLFLDEIGDLPRELQAKLLRVLDDKEVWPVGARSSVLVDVRVIASTNRDLREDVAAERFRQDLYYRLNVVHIALPPLRARREDIPLLVDHFIDGLATRVGRRCRGVEADALRALMDHDWRGNVRELEHVVESALISGEGETITVEDLPAEVRASTPPSSLRETTRQFERQQILDMLIQTGFDKREAARRLGLSLASLYRKLNGDAA